LQPGARARNPPPPQPTTPQHLRIHGGVVVEMGGALLLKRYARPSIEAVVDLPHQALSNGTCAASGRLYKRENHEA
jgi:hypothetical protein